jgi:TatD DNase family protein
LIIHTRSASEDTIRIMQEEGAGTQAGGVAGVMHCFTESLEVARPRSTWAFTSRSPASSPSRARKTCRRWRGSAAGAHPDRDRFALPGAVPHRGKMNEPGFVAHVAEYIAKLKDIPLAQVAEQTSDNFFKLFNVVA